MGTLVSQSREKGMGRNAVSDLSPDLPHVSKTCPAVSWFFSELHFSHTFLRTNIMQHYIRNFLPFPLITEKSVCTESLGCGKCLAHRFCWHSRVSYLAMPGSIAQDRKCLVDCPPVSMSLLSHNSAPRPPVLSIAQGLAPDSRAQQRGLRSPTPAPPPMLSAALTLHAFAAFFGSYLSAPGSFCQLQTLIYFPQSISTNRPAPETC